MVAIGANRFLHYASCCFLHTVPALLRNSLPSSPFGAVEKADDSLLSSILLRLPFPTLFWIPS